MSSRARPPASSTPAAAAGSSAGSSAGSAHGSPPGSPGWQPSARELARRAVRARQARRSTAVAVASSVVVAGVAIGVLVTAPGWPRVKQSFLNLAVARQSLPDVAVGLWLNIRVFSAAAVAILVVGLLLAVLRTLRGPVFWPVRALATAYVDVFRGLPLLLVLFLVGFGVPGLRLQGTPSSVTVLGTIALVLSYSAYVAEVFRAGIESVHPSQRTAARSLGLSAGQTMRLVVLPQAVRRVVPALMNDLVSLTKDSGLIAVLGIPLDAIRYATIWQAKTANFTPYLVAGLLFLLLTIPLSRLTDAVSRRYGYTPAGTL